MLPAPDTSENEYGVTPPDPENEIVELIKVVCDTGEIVNAGFTVITESAVAPKLSVTRTTADPELTGAV